MEKDNYKLIRRAQTISPFGVGAILDIEGESFVAADIRFWEGYGEIIHEPRLEKLLGVKEFRLAPAAPDKFVAIKPETPGVPFNRFPFWMFCPECRKMTKVVSDKKEPVCESCTTYQVLVPMRFVMACPRGHLSDIAWEKWAHSTPGVRDCGRSKLIFNTLPGGSGLEFLEIKCTSCGASRDLGGIASSDSMKWLKIRCCGLQPWQPEYEKETCDAVPQILQRGATNLTFSSMESSIDIPPHTSVDSIHNPVLLINNSQHLKTVLTYWNKNQMMVDTIISTIISEIKQQEDLEVTIEQVKEVIRTHSGGVQPKQNESYETSTDFMIEEFDALLSQEENYRPNDEFIKLSVPISSYLQTLNTDWADDLNKKISRLVKVKKLHEIRALKGFSRLSVPESEQQTQDDEPHGKFSTYGQTKISPVLVRPDLGKLPFNQKWLPAIEVYGEGIFISLQENAINSWLENNKQINDRVGFLKIRRDEHAFYLPEATARFILLHTLSHLLIRQLSFECGYSVSSIRERIYSSDSENGHKSMAGILIYTAAGDSEGTLGGLVREGGAERFGPILLKALQSAEWCSSDPICRESHGQGMHNLNLAACHACTLLPETSCVMSNRLLDRVLVVGLPEKNIKGFFTDMLNKMQ